MARRTISWVAFQFPTASCTLSSPKAFQRDAHTTLQPVLDNDPPRYGGSSRVIWKPPPICPPNLCEQAVSPDTATALHLTCMLDSIGQPTGREDLEGRQVEAVRRRKRQPLFSGSGRD